MRLYVWLRSRLKIVLFCFKPPAISLVDASSISLPVLIKMENDARFEFQYTRLFTL